MAEEADALLFIRKIAAFNREGLVFKSRLIAVGHVLFGHQLLADLFLLRKLQVQ